MAETPSSPSGGTEADQLRRLASFPEKNPNPVIEVDLSARVTYVNPQGRAHFGDFGPEHPIVAGLPEVVAMLKQGTQESINREVDAGGRRYAQSIVYLPEAELVRLYIHDITDRRAAELKLIRLASFPEKNPNPVLEVDLAGEVTYINPLARERFPDLEELGALHPVVANLAPIVKELASGKKLSHQREVTYRDFIYEQSIVYLADSELVRLYIHDVTSLRQLQARIQRNLAELERAHEALRRTQAQLVQSEKMAALGQLVAGIAHEINTPMGAIHSTHDTLTRAATRVRDIVGEHAPELAGNRKLQVTVQALHDSSKVIKDASERVIGIVDNMRNFARLDEADFKRVDINEGIEGALKMLTRLTDGRIEVIRQLGEVPETVCFPGRLNQAFLALLQNAVQAIEDRGRVRVSSTAEGGMLKVQIQDDGCGIAKETLERVFEPGFTTKGVGVGTGLGLSIARQTIEDHDGEISIESELGSGTTVTVTLPVRSSDSTLPAET